MKPAPDDETTTNSGKRRQKTTNRVRRNMQKHQKESNRGHQEIQPTYHTRNDHGIKEPEQTRSTQKLGQDRLITHLDKQDREIHDQNKIIERIEELYTELYDSEQSTIIHPDPKEVSEITSWEVEAGLREMTNGTATGNDHINIDTLKTQEDTISKTFAKLYTKMNIIFKKGNKKDFKNYRPICLLSNIYKVLKVLTKKAREDTRRKPAKRASRSQKEILNDRPHPRRKPTEGDGQRI